MRRDQPQFPVYIVSKGRWQHERRKTARFFDAINLPYFIVVEEQERQAYAEVTDPKKILVLDKTYQRDYDTCDELGDSKTKGSGPARNFVWDHAVASGAEYHWVVDDNFNNFLRYHCNRRIPVADGTIFHCMEDFVLRYRNIALAGPNYRMFVASRSSWKPFRLNTRIYSCILIRNDIPFRWRARYNEDTDLSLRVLKAKWCTVLFNTFLGDKSWTMQVKGGNTDELYDGKIFAERTMNKSKMIAALHPDVTRVTFRFQRWHHLVDYRPFKNLKPILREGIKIPQDVDEYGMILKVSDGYRRQKTKTDASQVDYRQSRQAPSAA